MAEDITQDPEYIKGYERGIRAYRYEQSLEKKGFHAGYHALETPKAVETKATPEVTISEDSPQFRTELISILREFITLSERTSENVKQLDERLKKLEKYTEE